ncbi:MAG: MCE family protein [Proteobacteria bacterium]|nr:MCE family protein [Pseudomonadota bacterium]
MENKAHALLAGLFTILLLAATIAIGMWFRRDRTDMVPYEIATKLSIPGLNPQAAVRYRGLDVGKVESIVFDPQVPGQILIRMTVKPDTPITYSTYGTLGYQGVTGIAFVQLDDDGKNPVRVQSNAAQVARIELRPSLFDSLQTRGVAILDQAEQLTRQINQLVNPENQKMILSAFQNIGKAASELETIPRQLQPTLEKLPSLTTQADKTLASITALSAKMQAPNGTVDQLNSAVDQVGIVANKIELQVLPLAGDARSGLRTLNRTLDTIREQPQSLLFGADPAPPGPGETGFTPPAH